MVQKHNTTLLSQAFTLRRNGASYNAIHKKLGIPKSTLSGWFKNDSSSAALKNRLTLQARRKAWPQLRLMALANKNKARLRNEGYRQQAKGEFQRLKKLPLFFAGLALYWGEGDRQVANGIVRIANTDPRLLRIFINFLISCCGIPQEKIYAWLLLYPDLKERASLKYWSSALDLPPQQFVRSQYIRGRELRKKLLYGVCTVQIYSREHKEKILEWIELLSQELNRAGIV